MEDERARANGADLLKYIQDCQDMATDISSLIESASVIDNEGTYPNGVTALLKVSGDMANNLASMLDSVNLPEATA